MSKINVTRLGNTVIMFLDGKPYQKTFSNTEEVLSIFELVSESDPHNIDDMRELKRLMSATKLPIEIEIERKEQELVEKAKSIQDIIDFMKDIRDNGHDIFEVKETSIYMKGINISIPEFLVGKIASATGELLTSYLNFWKRCALNPDPRARQDLFEFLEGGNFTITTNGYFVAYRNVSVKNEGNAELQKFVTQEFLKIKRWKKAPRNFDVYAELFESSVPNFDEETGNFKDWSETINDDIPEETGKYCLGSTDPSPKLQSDFKSWSRLGNLAELYENIAKVSETVYTDNHTKKMTIKIGELVQMDRKDCDADPRVDCSYGLHVGNKKFLSRNSFGSTGIVVLVNPSKVIAVPEYNKNKMRVCEYLPIAIADYDSNGKLIEVDTTELEYEYIEHDQIQLDLLIKESGYRLEELKKNDIIPVEISFESLKTIQISLEEATKITKNRIKKII